MIWSSTLSSTREGGGSYTLMFNFGGSRHENQRLGFNLPPLSNVGLRIYLISQLDFVTVVLYIRINRTFLIGLLIVCTVYIL